MSDAGKYGALKQEPFEAGRYDESRRADRRQTLATVSVINGPEFESTATVTNLSLEGAFIETIMEHPIGTRFTFDIDLPTARGHSIKVGGKVVRQETDGLGVRFDDMQSRDRSRIKQYARFSEMDDTVVHVQRSMSKLIKGNLLPISDREAIEERLKNAADNRLKALIVDPARKAEPIWAHIGLSEKGLRLCDMERPIKERVKVVYIIVFDGPLHFMFEGLLAEHGPTPLILEPQRMYHNERRSGNRMVVKNAWMEFEAPDLDGGNLCLPLVDLSERGCAIRASRESLIMPGMSFPAFMIRQSNRTSPYQGATVKRIIPTNDAEWLVGLNFSEQLNDRNVFTDIRQRSIKPKLWISLARFSGFAREKFRGLIKKEKKPVKNSVYVTRYKNNRGDSVASLLNATFDLHENPPDVDVAVVVAPAFLRRKEVFSLLTRTIIDNFKNQGLNAVVLRFDATHTVGESETDPELEAQGNPYLHWTFSHLESDIKASLGYVERRFRPKSRVLVTFSVAAISARRYIADGNKPAVDHWISPFGCPDVQDMFRNYLAGIDLFGVRGAHRGKSQ